MITSGALVCVYTVLPATTRQMSTEIMRSTKRRIGDSFSEIREIGEGTQKAQKGDTKAQTFSVLFVFPFCAFCGSFPLCWAKPLHIKTETLVQTEPAAAGCWWPTVGLRVDRPDTSRWCSCHIEIGRWG